MATTVCRFVAMSDKHTASRKVEWNDNFEAKNMKNYIKPNHDNWKINKKNMAELIYKKVEFIRK